jgi:sugar lactone lactonase YvrE
VDGSLKDSRTLVHSVTGTAPSLYVGVSLEGTEQAEAVMDELRVSSFPRLGNSDYVRLVVADDDHLLVFDLLGNLLSTYDEGNLSELRGMAIDKEGHIVVAEGGNDRLQVLDFDGVHLSFSHVITASLKEPSGVAIAPQGWIVVADTGNDLVKVLSANNGVLLAQYDRPNDAHTGPFECPEGVAIGPAGEIIVADTGNRRVASIIGGLEHRVYLPLINNSG